MDGYIWPEEGAHNAIIFYLMGRRKSTFIDDLIGLIPWVVLFAMEAAATLMPIYTRSLVAWRLLIPFQMLLTPLIAGLWAQLMVYLHYRRFRGRIPIEEVMVSRMTAREALCGFALRPIMLQVGANFIVTALDLIMILGAATYFISSSSLFSPLDFALIAALIVYRYFILKSCIEFAAIYAIRSSLFIEDSFRAVTRMVRDWILPWGGIPLGLVVLVIGLVLMLRVAPGFMCFFLPAILVAMGWTIWALPSLMRTFAQEVFYVMEQNAGQWAIRTGEDFPGVPANILKRWRWESRNRKTK